MNQLTIPRLRNNNNNKKKTTEKKKKEQSLRVHVLIIPTYQHIYNGNTRRRGERKKDRIYGEIMAKNFTHFI